MAKVSLACIFDHMHKLIIASFAILFGTVTGVEAQTWDSTWVDTVAPGVIHRRLVVNSGPWRMNVLEVNLKTPGLSIRGVRSNDMFRGRETVLSMVSRYQGAKKAVAAVNGDFFNVKIKTGESENNVLIEGSVWKGVRITDSPYDTYDNLHSQFGVSWTNRPFIDRFGLEATITDNGGRRVPLSGINFRQDSNAIVLYSPVIGDSTPVDSATVSMLSVRLDLIRKRGDTMFFRVQSGSRENRSARLDGGYSLAASGSGREVVAGIAKRGGTIKIVARIAPDRGKLRTIIGGWPRLVLHGRNVAQYADIVEGTFPRFSTGRHPRTAIGFSKDSSRLFLFTVDGRRESDAGMSLAEVGTMMINLGAHEAMAFDGGGSTTFVIGDKVVNRPSDEGGARTVGSGLLILLEQPAARR